MAYPLTQYAQFAAQLLPIVAALAVWGRRLPAPYPWVLSWCAFMALADSLDLAVAYLHGSNLWLSYFTLPTEVGLSLWFLALWQPNEFMRLVYQLAIPAMLVVTMVALLLADTATAFDLWVSPFLSLLALTAALATLVFRSITSLRQLTEQDWFWVCLGLAIFWIGFVAVPPFHRAFIETHREWVVWAYIVRAWTVVGAFLLMTWGVLCPRLLQGSPGRS